MTEATTLAATIASYDDARGQESDGAWAARLAWKLLTREVDPGLVRDGLDQALALVHETGESPSDLFGDASNHAEALYAQWLMEGRLVIAETDVQSWRSAVLSGLALSAAYAVVFVAMLVVDQDPVTRGGVVKAVLISLLIGMGTFLVLAVWGRRHRSRPVPADAPAELRWSLALTEILRSRHSMSAARVRDLVDEAHAHAVESGRRVQDDFGTAEEYAARFAPDRSRRSAFTAGLLGLAAALSALTLIDGFGWVSAVATACFASSSLGEIVRFRRLRTAAAAGVLS